MFNRLIRLMLTSLLLALPFSTAFAAENMLDKARAKPPLRVGFATFVPWAMQDKHGQFIGLEIDIAKKLGEDLGIQVEFVPTKWAGIIPALLTGQIDIVIAGMSITPERAAKVAFSIPYDYTGMDIAANKKRAKDLHTLASFNDKKVILVARTGGTAKAAIAQHFPLAQVRFFDEEAQAVQEVLSGKAHAFISAAPLPMLQTEQHPDKLFRPLEQTFTEEPIGFALRPADKASLEVLNAWIQKQHDNGWLQERKAYWFGSTSWMHLVK